MERRRHGHPGVRGALAGPSLRLRVSGIALLAGAAWGPPLVALMAVMSLGLTLLDWSVAYAGAVVNVVILGVLWLGPVVSRWFAR